MVDKQGVFILLAFLVWITFKKFCPTLPLISIGYTGCICTELSEVEYTCFKYCQQRVYGKRIHYLRVCRIAHLPKDIGLTTYITKIRPVLEYASSVQEGLPTYLEENLQRLQNTCLNVIGLPLGETAKRRNV